MSLGAMKCAKCSREWIPRSSASEPCPFCRAVNLEKAVRLVVPRMNMVTAPHRHKHPAREGAIDALYDVQLELERLLNSEPAAFPPEFLISAVYFPAVGEVDFGIDSTTHGAFGVTMKVTPQQGHFLAQVFYPCVRMTAAQPIQKHVVSLRATMADILDWLQEPPTPENARWVCAMRPLVQKWYIALRELLREGAE